MACLPFAWTANAAENPKSADLLLTPEAALRCADGEMRIQLGETPVPVTLPTWQALAGGVIAAVTRDKACEYEFRFHQLAGTENPAAKVGVIEVTAANLSTAKAQTHLWVSWKTAAAGESSSSGFRGVLLAPAPPAFGAVLSATPAWNPAATWYFLDSLFLRGDAIVYHVDAGPGWDRIALVRVPELPYRDLTPETLFGHTRLTRELKPEERAAIRVFVPYHPWPLEQRPAFDALIHPGG
ncbi:MAG: hypothetical protein ACE15F_16120 [bacterium]